MSGLFGIGLFRAFSLENAGKGLRRVTPGEHIVASELRSRAFYAGVKKT
jgi:hypothetical protein